MIYPSFTANARVAQRVGRGASHGVCGHLLDAWGHSATLLKQAPARYRGALGSHRPGTGTVVRGHGIAASSGVGTRSSAG